MSPLPCLLLLHESHSVPWENSAFAKFIQVLSAERRANKLGTTPLGQAKFAAKIGSLHRPSSGIPTSFRNQGESAAHGISKNEVSPEQHAK